MMFPEPQAEHRWLHQIIGDWTYVGTCNMGPDQPQSTGCGRESVRSLGGLWIVIEGEGEMPGSTDPMQMLIQLGFDPSLGLFRGTWIGSIMPMLWIYEGSLDSTGKILTLRARGPSMTGDGSITDYEDIHEVPAPGQRRFRSRTMMPDGTWNEFMSMVYQRAS